jgi:hypothetical protein
VDFGSASLGLKRFDALMPGAGAEGTLRGLSASGQYMVMKAKLSDGSQALIPSADAVKRCWT